MNRSQTIMHTLFVAMVSAMFLTSPVQLNAAGTQDVDRDRTQDKVVDQLRVRDGTHSDAVTAVIFEGDQDQDRMQLRDGSCLNDCDGEPDQDRIRAGQ